MGKINDLNQGNLGEVWAAIKKLQYATSQNNMAVGRGGITVYGGGGITIENGGLYVNGSATISGTLIAEGEIEMSGTFTATGTVRLSGQTDVWGPLTVTGDTDLDGLTTITGDTTVTGDFNVDGPMKTTGTLDVEGVTTLKNDLNVTTGKIVAGAVTIDPGYFDGSVRFSNGSYIAATPNGAQFIRGSGAVTVSNGQADMGVGTNSIIVNTVGTFLNGLPTTTSPANLYISEGGRVYRSTA
ncbi:hypothetical protein AAHB34_16155 [Paenarthrobacter ureafaciens]